MSQAALLKRKREARKAKILSNSKDRLDQITLSQTAPNPDLDEEKDFATEMASLPQNENVGAVSGGLVDKEEEVTEEKPSSFAVSSSGTPLLAGADVELPSIDPLASYDDLSSAGTAAANSTTLQFTDSLSWAHAVVFSLLISTAIANWVLFHTHDMFSLGSIAEDIMHKRICRQLNWMAYNPMHEDLGASSVISLFGYTTPAWQFFLTLELLLLSVRFYSIQRNKKTAPFTIPDSAKQFMLQCGFDPLFYEKVISSVYGYYDMYDTLMRDMYLVLAIIGSSISLAVVAHVFGYCH